MIIGEKISSQYFTYNKSRKAFVAEISDLPKSVNIHSQLYDDACDMGFTLVSHKTGREVSFYYDKADVDGEGEIQGWRFCIIPKSEREYPQLRGATLLIIND